MAERSPIHFREEQRLRQPALWIGAFAAALPAWLALIAVALPEVRGNPGVLAATIVLWFTTGLLLPAMLFALKLTVEVRDDGLYLCLSPLHLRFRRIAFADMQRVEAVRYRPILDYGGWGIRLRARRRAYSLYGDRGVKVTLPDGRTVLVGSQRADRLAGSLIDIGGIEGSTEPTRDDGRRATTGPPDGATR